MTAKVSLINDPNAPRQFEETTPKERQQSNHVTPRDAATLILVRQSNDETHILMGRRSSGHDFMPDKYVFPGGRVDQEDEAIPYMGDIPEICSTFLEHKADIASSTLAIASIREVFEETGLLIGKEAPTMARRILHEKDFDNPDWNTFYGQGVVPDLSAFYFVGRAITPPYRPKRFDARFFMADANEVIAGNAEPEDSFEMLDTKWVTLDEAKTLNLPNITRFVLSEVESVLGNKETHAPFYSTFLENEPTLKRYVM